MKGMRIARPGSNILLNRPMRSTIHAVCCGTKRTTVFVGVRLCVPKYEGGLGFALACPREPKMLCGLLLEAECELSCVKVRMD